MCVDSLPVGLVLFPGPIVDVSIRVNESASACGLVVFPVAFVNASVGPDLASLALADLGIPDPLPRVECVVFQLNFLPFLETGLCQLSLKLNHFVLEFAELFPFCLYKFKR